MSSCFPCRADRALGLQLWVTAEPGSLSTLKFADSEARMTQKQGIQLQAAKTTRQTHLFPVAQPRLNSVFQHTPGAFCLSLHTAWVPKGRKGSQAASGVSGLHPGEGPSWCAGKGLTMGSPGGKTPNL